MNKRPPSSARSVILAALLFVPAAVFAALPSRPDGFVTDDANVLSDGVEQGLERMMTELKTATGAEIAVVTVASLDGRDVAQAAEELFRSWGVGRKGQDDGLLLLVAPSERKARIEVGYGFEELIPDGRAGRILDEEALPRFRSGDIEGGVASSAMVLAGIVAESRGVALTGAKGPRAPSKTSGVVTIFWLIVIIAIGIRNPWLLLFFLNMNRRHGGGPWRGGGFGGFGGFGGGRSGGGGASRGW